MAGAICVCQSAQAISRLGEVLGESLSPYYQVVLESLMKELPGRLWEGKNALLHAVGALSSTFHKAISLENPELPNTILGIIFSACKKKVKKYREAAFLALNEVIKAFDNPEFFGVVFPLLYGMCSSAAPVKSGSDVAGDPSKSESDVSSLPHEKLLTCMMSCIHVAHPNDIFKHHKDLIQMVSAFLSLGFQWTVKMSTFSVIVELCHKIRSILDDPEEISVHSSAASLFDELFHSSSPKIVDCLSTVKIAQVHVSASECLLEMIKLHKNVSAANRVDMVFKRELLHHYEVEKSEEAKSNLKQCIDILEDLDIAKSPAT